MKFSTEKTNDVLNVTIQHPNLDAGVSNEFEDSMMAFLSENRKVTFDLSQVSTIDSAGCGALLACLKKLNSQNGVLKLYGVQKQVLLLLKLVRMHRLVDIMNTREEAIMSF